MTVDNNDFADSPLRGRVYIHSCLDLADTRLGAHVYIHKD
jgi:hypothetical protein